MCASTCRLALFQHYNADLMGTFLSYVKFLVFQLCMEVAVRPDGFFQEKGEKVQVTAQSSIRHVKGERFCQNG